MKYHRVKNHEELVRDPHSKAVLVSDQHAYMKYLQDKRNAEESRMLSKRVDNLENKMDQILSLLQQSINNK